MITIPAEALFYALRDETPYKFTDLGKHYYLFVSDRNYLYRGYEAIGVYHINITKAGFMELLLNRTFVCDEYELKIQL